MIRTVPTMPAFSCLLYFLLLSGSRVLAICPRACSCSHGHRVADCSGQGLSQLPEGLQHNIRFLNLSHNRLQDLGGRLSHFGHLRTLDISHNRLLRLPSDLPRALWDVRAGSNQLRQLEKNDTAYQWNLRELDLSANGLERVVFINNTLPGLRSLNLSYNKFWTVPTNMPHNMETVDLSHNYLVQILPGSLDRLARLARFYLHGNRFSSISEGAFDHLDGLQVLTLGDNPWACEDEENMTHLMAWVQHTPARVLGCPCHTRHTCGEARLAATGTGHSASYTDPPLRVDGRDAGVPRTRAVTSGHSAKSALLNPASADRSLLDDADHGTSLTATAQTSTSVPARGAKKVLPGRARSTSRAVHGLGAHAVALKLSVTVLVLEAF
ncbi:oligodendrocyte-myelin glycoprotein isoform X2 [Denticeps clupeoides]|uniref:oligodendrocyte-myelin glycoprotein isoform X2 n=1 Tax=Denticeps clupeoides TaxID=299321 RepID=UPI0010A3DA2D|nr:oligodendrocyte-myelin glycoprotein-like isoform X2 [Denticeps clupeoides]